MPSCGFCFRPSTRKGGGAGSLYLRVVHGSLSRSVTTPYRIFPEEWDSVRRRLIIPYERSERTRALADIESSMLGDLRRMETVVRELEKNAPYTIDTLMAHYRRVMTGNTAGAFAEHLATDMERGGYRRTANVYRIAAGRLRRFNGGRDPRPEEITPALLSDFQQTLKAEGCTMNTISFYMRTLRAIFNKAVAEGRVARPAESPFAGVYTGISTTRKLALTRAELARLSALELPDGQAVALAMFLFCYHARGMSFVDMAHLRKSDLRGDTIVYRRKKTGREIELRVLPVMRRIIDRLAPLAAAGDYLFPVIVDRDKDPGLQYESGLRLQNTRLKKIAKRCGISKSFSTHSARHSWATMAKGAGVPLAVISDALGHTGLRTTEIYLASLERSVLDHAARVVSDAIDPDTDLNASVVY